MPMPTPAVRWTPSTTSSNRASPWLTWYVPQSPPHGARPANTRWPRDTPRAPGRRYAPGDDSLPRRWRAEAHGVSQVAQERTKPAGRVLGIDLIPAQPPRGVSTIQGNFLSPGVQALARQFLAEAEATARKQTTPTPVPAAAGDDGGEARDGTDAPADVVPNRPSYIDLERASAAEAEAVAGEREASGAREGGGRPRRGDGRMVDVRAIALPEASRGRGEADLGQQVLLSDMSAPWPQTAGFSVKTLSNPYIRMMNTSGMSFRDHAGSMVRPTVHATPRLTPHKSLVLTSSINPQDLCYAALVFANTTLRTGGHFICKFYQGSEDKLLETRLKKLFTKVHREKPESSRSVGSTRVGRGLLVLTRV